MFYLLEDNRIIETTKEYEVEYIKDPYFNSKNEYQFVYVKDLYYQGLQVLRNATTEETIGFIKKQSENVFDLVEKTDLIKLKFGDAFNILEVNHINGGVKGMRGILAIYKPNSHGDYIKVWEKKDDN